MMKSFRKVISIFTLMIALAVATYAGDMQAPGRNDPPPPPPSELRIAQTTPTDVPVDVVEADILLIVFNALQTMLTVF